MLASIFLAAASLLTFTSAVPTAIAEPDASPAELAPRACTTIGATINILKKGEPDNPSNGRIFNIVRTGTPLRNEYISVVTFTNIPQGSTGCMLKVSWPPHQYPNMIASGPSLQADVWTVAPDPNGVATYNHPPARDQFVSTLIFPTAKTDQSFETYLYSSTCKPTMSFLFEHSTWQQDPDGGSVRFYNTPGGEAGLPPQGFSLVYNC